MGFLVTGRELAFYEDAARRNLSHILRDKGEVVGFAIVCDIKDALVADDREEVHQAGLEPTMAAAPHLKWFVQTAIARDLLQAGYGSALYHQVFAANPGSAFGASLGENAVSGDIAVSNEASAQFHQKAGLRNPIEQ